jgi:hypothetical protein
MMEETDFQLFRQLPPYAFAEAENLMPFEVNQRSAFLASL